MTFGEADVGINLFYSDVQGDGEDLAELRCAFKHRFSDFIVNEIDQEGEVVWFRPEQDLQKWRANAAQPAEQADNAGEEEEKKGAQEGGAEPRSDGMSLYPETWTKLEELLSESDFNRFREYVEGLKSGSVARDTWLVLEEEFTEKERRAKVH